MSASNDLQTKFYKLRENTEYKELTFSIDNKKFVFLFNDHYNYCTSNDIDTTLINISLASIDKQNINVEAMIMIIKEFLKENESKKKNYFDNFSLFSNKKIITKYALDKKKLYSKFINLKSGACGLNKSIPKELQFNTEQVFNIIIQEIERLNQNMDCNHYIVCNNNNPYDLGIRFVYKKGVLGKKLELLNKIHNFDYFEINFKLDPNFYPFVPPEIEYVKPKIDVNLICNILNLDIWNIQTWNYTISLDKLVINLGEKLETYLESAFTIEEDSKDILFSILEQKFITFNKLVKEDIYSNYNIKLDFSKLSTSKETKNTDKYWSSGVGYGHGDASSWNIQEYIESQQNSLGRIILLIDEIYQQLLKEDDLSKIYGSNFLNYIVQQLNTTLLDFNKKIDLFKIISKILKLFIDRDDNQEFINSVCKSGGDLINDMKTLYSNNDLSKTIDDKVLDTYLEFFTIYDLLNQKLKIEETMKTDYVLSDDLKENYCEMVKKYQFDNEELDSKHRFYKYNSEKIGSSTVLRVMSEISSLRKNLPINWDSSILMRVPKSNMNLITFLIIGPKDTPYHNGVFEFHAYFPDTYPKIVPRVLLETTGGGRVRFNPNLYNCGKVCLSLLGTWSGDQGEKWNPQISTFLQVLISIQSLIMVENPYFNEPSYERSMHTEHGKAKSFDYTDNIRLETIRVAMIETIKNKNKSYSNFIDEHFKFKKDEIYSTITEWINTSIKRKSEMTKAFNELKKLLD